MPVGPMGEPMPYPDEMGAGGGLPPELASLIGGGGQEAPPQDASGYVQAILEMLNEWRMNEQDPEDLLALEKISTMLQQIVTGHAKEEQQAMAGKFSPRMMAQAYGGGV